MATGDYALGIWDDGIASTVGFKNQYGPRDHAITAIVGFYEGYGVVRALQITGRRRLSATMDLPAAAHLHFLSDETFVSGIEHTLPRHDLAGPVGGARKD